MILGDCHRGCVRQFETAQASLELLVYQLLSKRSPAREDWPMLCEAYSCDHLKRYLGLWIFTPLGIHSPTYTGASTSLTKPWPHDLIFLRRSWQSNIFSKTIYLRNEERIHFLLYFTNVVDARYLFTPRSQVLGPRVLPLRRGAVSGAEPDRHPRHRQAPVRWGVGGEFWSHSMLQKNEDLVSETCSIFCLRFWPFLLSFPLYVIISDVSRAILLAFAKLINFPRVFDKTFFFCVFDHNRRHLSVVRLEKKVEPSIRGGFYVQLTKALIYLCVHA